MDHNLTSLFMDFSKQDRVVAISCSMGSSDSGIEPESFTTPVSLPLVQCANMLPSMAKEIGRCGDTKWDLSNSSFLKLFLTT